MGRARGDDVEAGFVLDFVGVLGVATVRDIVGEEEVEEEGEEEVEEEVEKEVDEEEEGAKSDFDSRV
jgi:hypothetical protein